MNKEEFLESIRYDHVDGSLDTLTLKIKLKKFKMYLKKLILFLSIKVVVLSEQCLIHHRIMNIKAIKIRGIHMKRLLETLFAATLVLSACSQDDTKEDENKNQKALLKRKLTIKR